MNRVLLVDDDRALTGTLRRLLEREQFNVVVAHDGYAALALACQSAFDAILVDLQLPNMSGIDLLRLGARDYLEKPFTRKGLVDALGRAASSRTKADEPSVSAIPVVHHAAARWARAITRAAWAPTDPNTLNAWGRVVHAAPGTLKSWCGAAGVSGRASLDLLRMLRAVVQARRLNCPPSSLLDGDSRTLRRLLVGAGMRQTETRATEDVTPVVFLGRQRFVTDRIALGEILRLLDSL
jgi:CheY-like chemotaxis protein